MSKQPLKSGEKILLSVFGVMFVAAMAGYAAIETVRIKSDKPMYAQTTFFDFSEAGKKGSELYRQANCNSCHRAVREGTSMGLSLDGIGSRRTKEWIEEFLLNPEKAYGKPTIDHGSPPKEAAYTARLDPAKRQLIATFLSELKATTGSASAEGPPPGDSQFIDAMVKTWAPDSWKDKYTDIRERGKTAPVKEGERK
jgi:hypothetical protein